MFVFLKRAFANTFLKSVKGNILHQVPQNLHLYPT